jgi:Mlc titration factor MtfA (ptsG expression regulator)
MISTILRRARRKKRMDRPFPPAWRGIVDKRLSFVDEFADDAERGRFFDHLKIFAWEKRFEGARGLEVTDEMRVVVSGCAARLSRNLSFDVWDDLGSVVLVEGDLKRLPDHEGGGRVLGLAHHFGTVVLSWNAVKHGIANDDDGHDVTLHELAHIFDAKDGGFDGTPVLHTPNDVRSFARAFSRAYLSMQKDPDRHVLRAYAATNEAEFFAVATEVFFEKPGVLKRRWPDVYAVLARVYHCDPASTSGP